MLPLTTKAEKAAAFLTGIVVAMPEERRAILARATNIRKEQAGGCVIYNALLAGRLIAVIEAGMGIAAASAATKILADIKNPQLLVSAGFCGAVRSGCAVGDIILCKQLWQYNEHGASRPDLAIKQSKISEIENSLQQFAVPVKSGCFITTSSIVSKAELAAKLPADLLNPVLEMETAAVAKVAANRGIPFLGIRTVSDDAGEELLFSMDEISKNNRISIFKLLVACLKKPAIVPQLARLAKTSAIAGKSLGIACTAILKLNIESINEPIPD